MSMFEGAKDININGSNFHINGPSKRKTIADAMALLSSRAESGAPYDAAAREDVAKCHDHTRVAIINGVHRWAHSREADAPPLMWMHGPAGSGKTTIMQTVAETFDKEGILAASFFFSTQSTARPTDKENFVITLVHQLSLHIPALQQHLADALSDTSILTKSLSKQLDVLVIGPLNKLTPEEIRHRRIVLVDGLDECTGDAAQHLVLTVLEQFLHQVHYRIRILVASRPLSHIRGFFSRGSITELTQTTSLDNNQKSDTDIRRYLISRFWSIQDEHPESGGLSPQWPSQYHIDILVQRASGRFIYASTVMKIIANPDRHPYESLQNIIDSNIDDGATPPEPSQRKDSHHMNPNAANGLAHVSALLPSLQHLAETTSPSGVDVNLQTLANRGRTMQGHLHPPRRQRSRSSNPLILEVPEGHTMCDEVEEKFQSGWKPPGGTIPTIKRVFRIIENQSFLQSYDTYRRAHGNEEYRFHGTSRKCTLGTAGNTTLCNIYGCDLCSILRTSFKASLGDPIRAFGDGVYSSSASNKAYGYTGGGTGAMLLTKVVMGRVYYTHYFNEVSSCPTGYDSVEFVRNNGVLNETIVYTNNAIQPVFLITF